VRETGDLLRPIVRLGIPESSIKDKLPYARPDNSPLPNSLRPRVGFACLWPQDIKGCRAKHSTACGFLLIAAIVSVFMCTTTILQQVQKLLKSNVEHAEQQEALTNEWAYLQRAHEETYQKELEKAGRRGNQNVKTPPIPVDLLRLQVSR